MKRIYNLIFNFCIPEKRCCFLVRITMQIVQLSSRKQKKQEAKYLSPVPGKKQTKHLTAIDSSFRPVWLNPPPAAKASGLKGSGALLFFSC